MSILFLVKGNSNDSIDDDVIDDGKVYWSETLLVYTHLNESGKHPLYKVYKLIQNVLIGL